jgi:Phage gp6-like head-tail connector protein
LAEVKAQLRLDSEDEDALLNLLIDTARENFEAQTGRLLLSQTVRVMWDEWPFYDRTTYYPFPSFDPYAALRYQLTTLCLPLYPARIVSQFSTLDENGDAETVTESTRLRYIDEDGILQTVDPADYTVDYAGKTPRIVLNPDVDMPSYGNYPNAIQVEYVAGETTAATVPADVKQAILLLVTMLYERREDMKIKGDAGEVRTYDFLQFSHRSTLI